MTLRLSDEESAALSMYALEHGRSMQDVARTAIREYVSARVRTRQALLARIVAEDAEALNLLAQ